MTELTDLQRPALDQVAGKIADAALLDWAESHGDVAAEAAEIGTGRKLSEMLFLSAVLAVGQMHAIQTMFPDLDDEAVADLYCAVLRQVLQHGFPKRRPS